MRRTADVTEFRVWAPAASRAAAEVSGRQHEMSDAGGGWWSVAVPGTAPQARYGFRLDDGDLLADPRSPRQPDGPAGLSQCYDHAAFSWTDGGWRGVPLPGSVVYELHVGTFTAEGTFDAAIKHLDHLCDLGVDTVELMPVAAFPGKRGWGYDGISLWAVHEPYGGPDGLKRFVSACHARRLAVMLDVVYNHVGIGNRLADFGPYFTGAHVTPWGPAVNLDQPGSDEVRAFIIGNALMWLRDYHLDGLRLDAVHALADSRALHLLEELATEVQALAPTCNRELMLIAESDANDPRLVTSLEAGGYGLTAQWSDDFHHALHAALTGERQGYYGDFGSMAALAKTWTSVFFHDGSWSEFRGRTHGRPVDVLRLPAHRFLGFLQDHDQVGNRAAGDRISASVSRRSAESRRRPAADRAVHPDAVHGRGMGGADAVAVLHRPSRRRARPGSGRWPASRVRPAWLAPPTRCPIRRMRPPSTRSKLDWTEPGAGMHAELAGLVPHADRVAPSVAGADRSAPRSGPCQLG